MRGFTLRRDRLRLRALAVCFVVFVAGCFSMSGSVDQNGPAKTPTHAYWRQVSATLAQKSTSNEMRDLVRLIRAQTDALRALSPEGVDPGLVAAVDDLIRCEDQVLEIAATANNDGETLRRNELMAKTLGDANFRAAEAKKRLKGLRDSLNARHGGGFAPIA